MQPLYTEICAGMRAFLDDVGVPGGAEYTDEYCQQYVEPAQRTLVAYLISNSVQRCKFRTEPALTVNAGTRILDYATTNGGESGTDIQNVLPDEFDVADQLFEAKVGGLEEDFIVISGPNELPRVAQVDTLRYWDSHDGRIHFLGATQPRLVRIDYWAYLPSVNPAGRLKGVASGNALIALAASDAAAAKGQHENAARLATFDKDGTIGGRAGWELMQIINTETKAGQAEARRRRPYFGTDRYSNQTYSIRRRD